MALFAIPNPKKSIAVDFTIERVKLSVLNISFINKQYKFTNSNEIFHQYTFEAYELLSLGVYIDIHLSSLSENKTEITVEVRRKMGSFDQSHEVTKANEHLVKIFDSIAKLTQMSQNEIDNLKINEAVKTKPVQTSSGPWYEKKGLLVFLCIVLFPVGIYGLWKNSSIKTVAKVIWTFIILILFIAIIGGDKDKDTSNEPTTVNQESTDSRISIGQVLKTDYFDIVVNKIDIQDKVNTGNQYSDLKPEQDIKYLIINTTFKNTDAESRMITDGSVWINYNGKDYEFDKSEVIISEGYGVMLEQINPLTTKTTNLVYKIPAEITGSAYLQPGRANDDERIFLGTF